MQTKCVRCAGNHPTENCTKDEDTPPTCARCSQQHPGNYLGCDAVKAYKARQQAPAANRNAATRQGYTFANATAHNRRNVGPQPAAIRTTAAAAATSARPTAAAGPTAAATAPRPTAAVTAARPTAATSEATKDAPTTTRATTAFTTPMAAPPSTLSDKDNNAIKDQASQTNASHTAIMRRRPSLAVRIRWTPNKPAHPAPTAATNLMTQDNAAVFLEAVQAAMTTAMEVIVKYIPQQISAAIQAAMQAFPPTNPRNQHGY
ncbi:flocculation protein FLO11-like [Schistocerca piceifrons]|uniref:flocculation protein FLO11-like n=1 Tax=Schistocerca piceifrons TaxID=274613 RepID=UPI001F5EF50C|nr:flocculation protein FLO11-like [Schistocerca piceifrons]